GGGGGGGLVRRCWCAEGWSPPPRRSTLKGHHRHGPVRYNPTSRRLVTEGLLCAARPGGTMDARRKLGGPSEGTLMLAGLLCSLALAAPVPTERPDSLRLLADDALYQKAPEIEAVYESVPESRAAGASVTYRLTGQEGGKPVTWPLHVPFQPERLTPFVGKRVRVSGKLITARERADPDLWPGRLEAVAAATVTPAREGIAGRSPWQPATARRAGARQFVLRDARQAAEVLGLRGPGADEA